MRHNISLSLTTKEVRLQNLAGVEICDQIIEHELKQAGINPVRGDRVASEVATRVTGQLGNFIFRFRRAWRYWVVEGNVPLNVAQELYADPVGKTDIRVEGDCTRPAPEERISWFDRDGKGLLTLADQRIIAQALGLDYPTLPHFRFVADPSAEGRPFVTHYHIDSEDGLRLFVDTLKKHGLV